jgi:hypothetical protein
MIQNPLSLLPTANNYCGCEVGELPPMTEACCRDRSNDCCELCSLPATEFCSVAAESRDKATAAVTLHVCRSCHAWIHGEAMKEDRRDWSMLLTLQKNKQQLAAVGYSLLVAVATASEWQCFWSGYQHNIKQNIETMLQLLGA